MKRLLIVLFFLAPFLYSVSPREVLSEYYKNLEKLKSVKGKMVVEVKRGDTYNYTKFEYISKGIKFYMKAPPPMSFILVSDGRKVHFYHRSKNQVYLYYPGQYLNEYKDPVKQKRDILKDVPDLQKIGKKYFGWKKIDVYEGKPHVNDKFISKFRVWIDTEKGFLYRFESFDLHEDLVSRVDFRKYRQYNGVWFSLKTLNWSKTDKFTIESTTEFKDVEVNVEIEDSFFDFKIPEGAKIKDLTKMIMKKDEKK